MPLFFLLSIVILIPLVEIGVFIEIGSVIGLWPTLGAIVLTAISGMALIRKQGLATLARAQNTFTAGQLPVRELFDGFCLLLAGAFLLTPGFVTDALGGLLLIPWLRDIIRTIVLPHFLDSRRVWMNGEPPHGNTSEPGDKTVMIEGNYTVSSSEVGSNKESSDNDTDRVECDDESSRGT